MHVSKVPTLSTFRALMPRADAGGCVTRLFHMCDKIEARP